MWNYEYVVPENKKVRMIVHTDCKNEADDQFALAHHLMTPRFDLKGIVAGHFWKNPFKKVSGRLCRTLLLYQFKGFSYF